MTRALPALVAGAVLLAGCSHDLDRFRRATTCTPTGAESCDGVDNDCDGSTDETPAEGSCSIAGAVAACVSGECTIASCSPGFGDCDGDMSNGCEADFGAAATCGSCGTACAAPTPLCDSGTCAADCPAGTMVCDGGCVDTSTSLAHCGGCDAACVAGMRATAECVAGACQYPCESGFADCDSDPTICETTLGTANDCSMCGESCGWGCGATGCDLPIEVATGDEHTCVRLTSGQIFCWGSNDRGQLGVPASMGSTTPIEVTSPSISDTARIEAGRNHTCAVSGRGNLACWGASDRNQLGRSSMTDSFAPLIIGAAPAVIDISANADTTCVVSDDNEAWCWGENASGQTGTPVATNPVDVPTMVVGMPAVMQIASGSGHTCAISDESQVWCWGLNTNGELGRGMAPPSSEMPAMVSAGGVMIGDAAQVGVGGAATCVLRSTMGDLWCWGLNTDGIVGEDPAAMTYLVPQAMRGGFDMGVQLAMSSHACARTGTGEVACWGRNDSGQVGNDATDAEPDPFDVLDMAADVDVSFEHTCAVLTDGDVYCWGDNTNGELGDGTTTTRRVATRVVPPIP